MADVTVVRLFADGDKAMYPISESNGKTYFHLIKITNVKEYERETAGTYNVFYNATVYSQVATTAASIVVDETKLITIADFDTLVEDY